MPRDVRKVIPSKADGTAANLAQETGGNLAALAGKDFATQATLALVKAKTDNLDLALTALRDALTVSGASTKNMADLEGRLASILASVDGLEAEVATVLQDSTFTARVGEVQGTPTVNTVLGRLKALQDAVALLLQESTFLGRVGEVQASPTANTLLDRLEAIKTSTDLLVQEATFTARLGEVQASPTANTLLDRLKTVHADLAALSKAENTAHASGDFGVMGMDVRRDAETSAAATDGGYAPTYQDGNGRRKVRAIPDRPSQGKGRTAKNVVLANQTASATSYTVTGGKVLYVTTLVVTAVNTSTSSEGDLRLRDGTGGTDKMGFLMAQAGLAAGLSSVALQAGSFTLPEPLQFTSTVRMEIVLGTIRYSISFIGYEE